MTQLINYSEALTRRIMRRVYFTWFVKRVAPTMALQTASLALLLIGVHEFISVKFVLANAVDSISSVPSLVSFTTSAVGNAGFIPQLLLGASTFLGLLIVRDVLKVFRSRTFVLQGKITPMAERIYR
ncbi:MAG: hypothetical protein HYT39_02730 [Candidatus Sungbacteria bacterium]|nr:hypothetical protein [Candidatus Sungbacteria bacterium]